MAGRGAKMRYMRCLFDSMGPIFKPKFFPLCGVELFAEYVRAPYDGACLKLNNSKRGRPTPECFAGLVQSYGLYEQLA